MRRELHEWRRAAAWAALILVATTVPLPSAAPVGWVAELHLNLAVHTVLYAGLGWFVAGALERTGRWERLALFTALAAGLVFAAVDEMHQRWIPGRTPELADWAADGVGLALGLLTAVLLRGR